MKAIIAAAVLAAAITAPAFAEGYTPAHGAMRAHAGMMHNGRSAYAWAPSGRRVGTSAVAQDRGFAMFGDSTDHLLPGEINQPGPR